MRIKVVAPVQVIHDGTRHTIGKVVDVPDRVGADWIRQGWATETNAAAGPRKKPG